MSVIIIMMMMMIIINNNNNNNRGLPVAQEEKYQGRKKTCDKK
jgi:hypothetical protein